MYGYFKAALGFPGATFLWVGREIFSQQKGGSDVTREETNLYPLRRSCARGPLSVVLDGAPEQQDSRGNGC